MWKVLIADGDVASSDSLREALSMNDCQVEVVSEGKEVLRQAARKEVDVVIIEVNLPDMPAWDLVPRLRQIDRDVPIIAVTADDSWETSRRVRLEGGPIFFYGLKPLDVIEIQQVVLSAVRWKQKRRAGRGYPGPGGTPEDKSKEQVQRQLVGRHRRIGKPEASKAERKQAKLELHRAVMECEDEPAPSVAQSPGG